MTWKVRVVSIGRDDDSKSIRLDSNDYTHGMSKCKEEEQVATAWELNRRIHQKRGTSIACRNTVKDSTTRALIPKGLDEED